MRTLIIAALGLIALFPLQASPASINPDQAHTLISVSHPGYAVSEVHSLCSVTLPGQVAPLHVKIVPSLAGAQGLVSIESAETPGYYLRHQNSRVKLHPYPENDGLFAADASFYLVQNPDGSISFRSYNYPNCYLTVTAAKAVYLSPDPDPATVRSFTLGN